MKTFHNICWFTNMPVSREPPPIQFTKHYDPADYPKYDNYDAIEVGRFADLPVDYPGVMGVPITALDKLQDFELLGQTDGHTYKVGPTKRYINLTGHGGAHNPGNSRPMIRGPAEGFYYTADNVSYPLKRKYIRLLIRW